MSRVVSIFVQSPHWDEKISKDWIEFMKWIRSKGGRWDQAMGAHRISFDSITDTED